MSILQAVVLGIVQGLTEFLPVSSSGHIELTNVLFNWSPSSVVFDTWLHGGTLLALIIYFAKDIFSYLKDIKKILPVFFATIPAVVIGVILTIFGMSEVGNTVSIAVALISIGVLFIFFEHIFEIGSKEIPEMGILDAIKVGLFESMAYISGVSRSGITIIGGVVNNLKFSEAVKFSFIAGIPIIGISFSYGVFKQLIGHVDTENWLNILIGFLTSFLTGLIVIKFMLSTLSAKNLKYYGIYRIVIGILVLVFFAK